MLLFVLFSGSALAAPSLSVSPSSIDDDVTAREDHSYSFTFSNENESEEIYDVTLQDTEYLTWNTSEFDLNASQSRTVTAVFRVDEARTVNDSVSVPYSYDGDSGLESNQSLHPEINFTVTTSYRDTDIDLNVLKDSFELEFDEIGQSVLEISNTGDEEAIDVEVSGEGDTEFRPSSFNLSSSSSELVEFNVSVPKPDDNATQATNQTFTRDVTVQGENFGPEEFEVEVFVPYKDYRDDVDEDTYVDSLIRLQETCEANPGFPGCGGDPYVIYENRTETEYRQPRANQSLTNETINNLNRFGNNSDEIIQGIRLSVNRSERASQDAEMARNQSERNAEKIDEIQENQQNTLNRLWIVVLILFGSIFLTALSFAGYKLYRRYENRQRVWN